MNRDRARTGSPSHEPRVPAAIAMRLLAALCAVACAASGGSGCRPDRHEQGSAGSAATAVSGRQALSGQGGDAAISGGRAGTQHASGQSGAAGTTQSADPASAEDAGASQPVEPTAPDGPNSQAFDPLSGALRVDYASYLSKHDIVYNKPNSDPARGLTVGNGRMGAMVWNASGLTLQVSGVDTSQQTAFSAGLANLTTTPALDSGSQTFQQRLALYDGVLSTQYDSDRTLTVMGSPNSEVMGIHVEDRRSGVKAVSFELSLWDLSKLANNGAVHDLNTWKTVSTYADENGAGLSRGQSDVDHFGYTLAASVEGSAFTIESVAASKVRLTITPSASYTIWIAAATRRNAADNDSLARAKSLLHDVRSAGYDATLRAYQSFWHDFWAKSFVQYANSAGDADYLENVYYLATYMIAAGGYAKYPFHFINGVFRASADETRWSNAYWYWNQRDVYSAFLAQNHADVMSGWNALYSDNFATLKAYTLKRYDIDGIWVPETMGWNGNADGTIGSDFTKNIYSTGTEAAANMLRQYAYTGDAAYLSATAYPFVKEVVKFYQGKLSFDSSSGKYFMASSNAHETYWNVKNAITDLAAVRSLFPLAIRVSQTLGLDVALRSQWQQVLDNLVAYPSDGTDYLPHDPPDSENRNGENVACELIWPYSVTGIGAADYPRALSTWKHRPHPYDNIWANDAIQAARLGLGDDAMHGMLTMLSKYQSYPNGLTNNTNGVFEYLGVHTSVMTEALLQSYDDKLRVFPAVPSDAAFVGRFTLAAQGGFVVSAEREAGDVKYIGLKSLQGNPASVINPWPGKAVRVRRVSDGFSVLTSAANTLDFQTSANVIYVIERVEKPLNQYTPARIAGARNQDSKHLANTSCVLGIPK